MARDAHNRDLLYISDAGTADVYVYSYPKAKLLGTLTGFSEPFGLCSDKKGDIFVTDNAAGDIVEYAHGGTNPINTLNDPGSEPIGCSIDRKTNNLAVSGWGASNDAGNVAIYVDAQGSPQLYTDSVMYYPMFCGYDDKSNLFVDGENLGSTSFVFAEFAKGGSALNNITLNQSISWPGGVQWDGKNVAVADENIAVIYQFAISGSVGTKVGSISLSGISTTWQFWKRGAIVVAPDDLKGLVGIYKYSTGGSPIKLLTGFHTPIGSTVSLAK
jgi:hypothetical protein